MNRVGHGVGTKADTPATTWYDAMALVTTAPATTTAPVSMVTPAITFAPAPIHTW